MLAVFYDGPQRTSLYTSIIKFNSFNTSIFGQCVEFDIFNHMAEEVRLVERIGGIEEVLWKFPESYNDSVSFTGIWQHIYTTLDSEEEEYQRTVNLELMIIYHGYYRGLAVALDNFNIKTDSCRKHCKYFSSPTKHQCHNFCLTTVVAHNSTLCRNIIMY